MPVLMKHDSDKTEIVGPAFIPSAQPTTEPWPDVTAPRTFCPYCKGEQELLDGLTPICCDKATREAIYGREAH